MKKIAQSIVVFIMTLLGAEIGKIVGIFFISMLPVVELRGSIPVGYFVGLNWYINLIVSIIGNMIPVPFILFYSVKVFEYMKKRNIMTKFIEKIEKRALNKSDSVAKKEFLGLMIFVGIPLPGTGAWTGSLIAAILKLDIKKSLLSIFLGVVIAAVLVTLGVYGILGFII